MDLRQLTPDLAVAPQIDPADVARLADAGFRTLINNRPDDEVDDSCDHLAMQAAADAAGMRYHYLPFAPGGLTPGLVRDFAEALRGAGPMLAYCRSGNRCTVLWALTEAGRRPEGEIIETAARAGYDLTSIRPMLSAAG